MLKVKGQVNRCSLVMDTVTTWGGGRGRRRVEGVVDEKARCVALETLAKEFLPVILKTVMIRDGDDCRW